MTNKPRDSRAFVAVEAVAITMVSLIFIGIILASMGDTRRQAMLNRDLANLRQMGAWTFAYANDYEDLYPSFSAVPNSIYPDLRATALLSTIYQARGHAIDIIRRRTGRHDFPLPSHWIPHILYTHLVLSDYTQRQLPDATFVSAGDKYRLDWLDDPINKHDRGFWQPYQQPSSGTVSSSQWRWPYSSSYQTPSAFWDKSPLPGAIHQGGSNNSYSVLSYHDFGPMPLSDVAYPAQKVLLYASGSWYTSRRPQFFLAESSSVTVLMTDGGATLKRTTEANAGWYPASPTSANSSVFTYTPQLWEPPAIDPGGTDIVKGHYRWTRGRLDGRDFDGPEIDTGQK